MSERKYNIPVWRKRRPDVSRSEPPITRYIAVPEKVAVRYLAEVSGQALHDLVMNMRDLRICVSVDRSVDFDDAARILRKYGIGVRRGG